MYPQLVGYYSSIAAVYTAVVPAFLSSETYSVEPHACIYRLRTSFASCEYTR